jgi:predicted NACHT family NTPase
VFEFAHLSFQEFLAAKDLIGDPLATRANNTLQSFPGGDNWWREVLLFYIGLSGKPRELRNWLNAGMRVVRQKSSRRGAVLTDARDQQKILVDGLNAFYPTFRLDC